MIIVGDGGWERFERYLVSNIVVFGDWLDLGNELLFIGVDNIGRKLSFGIILWGLVLYMLSWRYIWVI